MDLVPSKSIVKYTDLNTAINNFRKSKELMPELSGLYDGWIELLSKNLDDKKYSKMKVCFCYNQNGRIILSNLVNGKNIDPESNLIPKDFRVRFEF